MEQVKLDFQHTLKNFLSIDGHTSPQFSGTGLPGTEESFYFLKRIEGVTQVYKCSIEGSWPHQMTFFPEGVDSYQLSPDGRNIAVIENKAGCEQNPIAIVDTTSLTYRYAINIPDVQSNFIHWRPDNKGIIFRSNLDNKIDFKIYEYLFENEEYELVIDSKGYILPLDVSSDCSKILYSIRPSSANQDVYLFDRITGKSQHLTEHDGNERSFAKFGNSSTEVFLLSDSGEDFNKLYKFDISSMKKTEIGKSIPWDIQGFTLSSCKRYVLYASNREGYSDLHLVDTYTNTSLPTPRSNGVVLSYGFVGSKTLIYSSQSPLAPSNVYLFNSETQIGKQLTHSRFFGIDQSLFSEPQLVSISSFDELSIPAFLYLPKNYKKGTKIPMVVLFHGGPEGQSKPVFVSIIQQMLTLGIGVCLPNVRGSAGYGMHYQALDDYKKRMDSVYDGVEVGKWLIKNSYTTKDRLAVMGGSYGGFMCLSVITEAPDLWAAAIDTVGISNLETFLENTKPSRRKVREVEYGPLSDREFLRSISPIYKMDKVKTPLFVAHGRTDPRVPVSEAEQVVEVLQKNNQIVESLYFDDEGHGFRKLKNRIIYYEKVLQFLTKHLNMNVSS